ncbi:TetR family transcriptional regulator [Zhihengliuella sp.]|uniref:TetR family transcriptional regulator n=1 Tax=Zhihengliuella sp. TaxID=1954483 RepID=UPI00281136AB|nr:TetR family transcriptional regulator [Zhihengliuella sp.]
MPERITPFAVLSPERPGEKAKKRRTVGRPAVIDAEATAACALRLFDERGYDLVTMDQISKEAGIGRKSLYRYFTSKADLVWGGGQPIAVANDDKLDARGVETEAQALERLRDYARTNVAAEDRDVMRIRMRLTANHPELAGHAYKYLMERSSDVSRFLMEAGVPQNRAVYLASAFVATLQAAWTTWALSGEESPEPFIEDALAVVMK